MWRHPSNSDHIPVPIYVKSHSFSYASPTSYLSLDSFLITLLSPIFKSVRASKLILRSNKYLRCCNESFGRKLITEANVGTNDGKKEVENFNLSLAKPLDPILGITLVREGTMLAPHHYRYSRFIIWRLHKKLTPSHYWGFNKTSFFIAGIFIVPIQKGIKLRIGLVIVFEVIMQVNSHCYSWQSAEQIKNFLVRLMATFLNFTWDCF